MAKLLLTVLVCAAPAALSACAAARSTGDVAADGFRGSVHMASTGASMVKTTVGEAYNGMGAAVRAPFRDFNLMQEKIPAALVRSKINPYDTSTLTSCAAIEAEVATLDLALGPDVDTPRIDSQRLRSQRLASMGAELAVDAAKGAVDHFIPVRGVIRQVTGAKKYDKDMAAAVLAGSVRRGFLKAVGMQQNCAWPAAPIDFKPRPPGPAVQIASTTPAAPVAPKPVQIATASPTPSSTGLMKASNPAGRLTSASVAPSGVATTTDVKAPLLAQATVAPAPVTSPGGVITTARSSGSDTVQATVAPGTVTSTPVLLTAVSETAAPGSANDSGRGGGARTGLGFAGGSSIQPPPTAGLR